MSGAPVHPGRGGTVAIVTGASSGVGRALVFELTRRGCGVVVVYLRDQEAAEAVVDGVHAAGGTALAVRADLTDDFDVQRIFDETIVTFGVLDIVVHAARRGAREVLEQAARRLRRGGLVLSVSALSAPAPALADELHARDVTVNGLAPGLEPPGPDHELTRLVRLLDQWWQGSGR